MVLISVLAVPVLAVLLTMLQAGIYAVLVSKSICSADSVPPAPVLLMRSLIVVLLIGSVFYVSSTWKNSTLDRQRATATSATGAASATTVISATGAASATTAAR